jgi:hypothetical protein
MSKPMVRWDDFVQRVRRHRPTDLLLAIAATNISIAPDGMWEPDRRGIGPFYPWALAVAARESIRAGNEHRDPGVTEADLASICGMYAELYEPIVDDHDSLAALIRMAYEQFGFQESLYFGVARSRLLFEQPSTMAAGQLRIIDQAFWPMVLGHSLGDLFNAGLLLGVGALRNGGAFNLAWFQQPNFAPIAKEISEQVVRELLASTFAADIQTLKGMCPSSYRPGYERVSFNPLQARPFVSQGGERFIAPVPQFVFWRASAPALYYIALEKLSGPDKAAFTEDVGTLCEDYIIRQADQLPVQLLEREIEYKPGSHTTDAILVWPDFTLLIEVKATRLTEEARIGGSTLRAELNRTVSRAFEQLDNTAQLLRGGNPALAHIPSGNPIYGLVVTLEPYHVVNSPVARSELSFSSPSIPVAVASMQDFERFVADTLAQPLSSQDMASLVFGDPTAWDFNGLGRRRSAAGHRNPLLDAEFKKMAAFGVQVPTAP